MASYQDLGPGLHLLRESDPLRRASVMAESMRAELCATVEQADEVLSRRGELPPIDVNAITILQVLARRVARSQRIANRTRVRATEEIAGALAGGTGLAVHPETIRERAAALDRARSALAHAERTLADHEAEEAATAGEQAAAADEPPDATANADADTGAPARRPPSMAERRRNAIGGLAASFGLALLLLPVGVPLWVALLAPLTTSLWASRHLRPHPADEDQGRSAASSLLAAVSASTDELFGAMRASKEKDSRGALLTAGRRRAEEEVRVAERAWHALAGAGVDTDQLEEVVHRFDPQHEDARLLALETAGVRAVDSVLRQLVDRWNASWEELGLPAPNPAVAEAAIDDLARRAGRPIVLVGPATVRGPELARVSPAAPVVVLDGPLEASSASVDHVVDQMARPRQPFTHLDRGDAGLPDVS